MMDPNIINHTDVNDDIDTDLPESTAPMMNSQTNHKRPCFNSSARPMLDPEIVLDQVHSEGLRQWNMFMDGKYDYETVNGLPGYYSGDLYDTEDTDEFNPDVQEGIDFITYSHSRPDGGKTWGVDTVDMVYLCRTVSGDKPGAQDEPDRLSETDASHIEEVDIIGLCRCPEFGEGEDPSEPKSERTELRDWCMFGGF